MTSFSFLLFPLCPGFGVTPHPKFRLSISLRCWSKVARILVKCKKPAFKKRAASPLRYS